MGALPALTPLQRDLLDWWAAHGRDLPWRRSRDPWAVLVSELMLQQTQVARVSERYVRFLERFPTAVACASAPIGDVIDEWAGLGYNRRAVHLHRAASRCVEDHDGGLPEPSGRHGSRRRWWTTASPSTAPAATTSPELVLTYIRAASWSSMYARTVRWGRW